jgi:hypothetical protein
VGVENNLMSPQRCTTLQARAEQLVLTHPGPIWLLNMVGPDAALAQQRLSWFYGLQPAGRCMAWSNGLAPAQLCPQRRSRIAVARCRLPGAR